MFDSGFHVGHDDLTCASMHELEHNETWQSVMRNVKGQGIDV